MLKSRMQEGGAKGGSVWDHLDKVVFIDSTWQQTHRILIVSCVVLLCYDSVEAGNHHICRMRPYKNWRVSS